MSEPEIKMEKFNEIQDLVRLRRENEIKQKELNKKAMRINESLEDLGINCNHVTNCVAVGKLCFKCNNNYARRSYFRDLLQKGSDVSDIYAMDASMFSAVE